MTMTATKRYVFHCVADGVYGGPSPVDDIDDARLAIASYWGSHWDIYDTVEKRYVEPITCAEMEAEVRARVAARSVSSPSSNVTKEA